MLAKCNRLLQIKVLSIDCYKLKQQSNCGANETCRTACNLAWVKKLTVIWHGIKQDNDKKYKKKQKLVRRTIPSISVFSLPQFKRGDGQEGLLMAAVLTEGGGEMGCDVTEKSTLRYVRGKIEAKREIHLLFIVGRRLA